MPVDQLYLEGLLEDIWCAAMQLNCFAPNNYTGFTSFVNQSCMKVLSIQLYDVLTQPAYCFAEFAVSWRKKRPGNTCPGCFQSSNFFSLISFKAFSYSKGLKLLTIVSVLHKHHTAS
jgi:hypothetical protein